MMAGRFTCFFALLSIALCEIAFSDGKVMPPRDYKGSLEEKAQEAILIFHASTDSKRAIQDMILKIEVQGDADEFAWIIPLPNEPKIKKEDPKLFKELFDYVEFQKRRSSKKGRNTPNNGMDAKSTADGGVEVLQQVTVGDFEITTIRETEQGALNPWLSAEGYQTLDGANDVLDFYRNKNYVYACIKVSQTALASNDSIESHPLRFTFETGGDDGIFFPMKLTGLQTASFDVNLYVFYDSWLNDKLNQYGFMNRGMNLIYRDWDTPNCEPNAGKNYSLPEEDPLLRTARSRIPTVKKLFQKLYPGERFYLTNICARNLDPADVREWSDDLWLYPYYTDRNFVPLDVRGPDYVEPQRKLDTPHSLSNRLLFYLCIGICVLVAVGATFVVLR